MFMMTNNEVKGYGVAGSRHAGASQDAFWSSKGGPSEVLQQLGELYLFSDGVTHCADGLLASQLALQTVRKYYYGQRPTHDLTPAARLTRLQEAVWQAHLRLCAWDEKFYCKCKDKEAHPEGKAVTFSRPALEKWGRFKDGIALCPLCNERMDGLLASLLAVVIHEQHLFLVGVGDSFALHIPADPQQPIKSLYKQKKGEFLGNPELSYDQAIYLPYRESDLKIGDLIVLCSDGVTETLQASKGEIEWGTYLRQQLMRPYLSSAVPDFIKSLHRYRTNFPDEGLNDDLTMLAVSIRDGQEGSRSSIDSTVMVRSNGAAKKAHSNAPQVAKPLLLAHLSTRQKPAPLAVNYAGEAVGGHGVAGSRHEPPAQDAFWPSPAAGLSPRVLSRLEMLLAGRLYLLADGVTLCADGHQASNLAAQVVGTSYYAQPGHVQDASREPNGRLTEAIWQAHQNLQRWDEKFFCWRKEYHPPQHFTKKEIRWRNGQPICPLCGNVMAGLQTTLVVAVLRGRKLTVITVGKSVVLRVPANPKQPLEFLTSSKEPNFLGMPGLSSEHLYQSDLVLQPGDRLLLCGDGVIETLVGWQEKTDQNWHAYLRQRLNATHLQPEVQKIINELHAFRLTQAPHLNDDLTLLAVAIPNEVELIALREQVKRHSDKLNHLLQASVIQPYLYADLINALEAALLHEDEPNLWLQYGTALRERALAQMRKVGLLNDAQARTWMAQAVRAGDPEARRWQTVMKIAQQIMTWHDDKKGLLAMSVTEHKRVTNTLAAMKLVQTLPEVVFTLRNFLKRIAKTLKKAEQKTTAAYYRDLIEQWDVAVNGMSTNGNSDILQLPPARPPAEGNETRRAQTEDIVTLTLSIDPVETNNHASDERITDLPDSSSVRTIYPPISVPLDQADAQNAWALPLEEAQALNAQGKVVEAACTALRMQIPESLHSSERSKLVSQQRQFVNEAWQLAQKRAAAPQAIRHEERGDLEKMVHQLSKTQEPPLLAAGRLFAAALHFQADKRADAAECILEAWQMVEGRKAKKQQVRQLAEQIYLQPWEKVYFWQVERQRQLEKMRRLADQHGFSSINPQLTRTLDRQMGRVRNELMFVFAAITLFLLVGATLVMIQGANAESTNAFVWNSTPTETVSNPSLANNGDRSNSTPTDLALQSTDVISGALSATPTTAITTSTALPATIFVPTITPTVAQSAPTESPANAPATPWVPAPLAEQPVLIEMTLGEMDFAVLDRLISYFGQHERIRDERNRVDNLTNSYSVGQIVKSNDPFRGMLPADPLFLFVGQIAETQISDDQKLGFELKFPSSAENIPNVFVDVPYTDAQDRENKQQELERWRQKESNWAWVLASSPPLAEALLACRDNLAENSSQGIAGYECVDQEAFVAGASTIHLDPVVLMGIENGQLTESLLDKVTFEGYHWIYADLSQDGLQLALPQDARDEIQQRGLGLVRASWEPDGVLRPSDMLQRNTDGIYKRIGP